MSTSPQETSWSTLVSAAWLSEHLEDPDLVVLDCTVLVDPEGGGGFATISGRASYEAGHIPGAGFADLKGELRDSESPLQFALPTPENFCAAMGELGVGDASRVVLYDGNMAMWAARVWWMLRWVGFDAAALLDGGLEAWKAEGLPLSTEPATHEPRQLTLALRPELMADQQEVRAAINDDAVRLIDTFPAEHYRGEQAWYDRAGHIPSASNVFAFGLYDESGRYRADDELAAMHEGDRSTRAITYCGGGIMASASAFAMRRAGFDDVAVYIGSLEEWTADPDNPLTVEAT